MEWIIFAAIMANYCVVGVDLWQKIKPRPPRRRATIPALADLMDPTPSPSWRVRSMNDLSPNAVRMIQNWARERERQKTQPWNKVDWKKEGF